MAWTTQELKVVRLALGVARDDGDSYSEKEIEAAERAHWKVCQMLKRRGVE